jgi:cell division transport system ATP-binding protein
MKVIESINKDLGTTIIMATHDKDIVNKMKKRVITINKGMVASDNLKGRYKVDESI